ncbi:MAG: hypothetical protein DWQ07_10130 [Chloroflexi bacterium]|nr:MAG: hypothetical protein DWQ07_10130 [Chloroflexota bacterium]MBL1192932.1 hypothetical protein [Chloroflexota bacterium]
MQVGVPHAGQKPLFVCAITSLLSKVLIHIIQVLGCLSNILGCFTRIDELSVDERKWLDEMNKKFSNH